MQLDRIQCQEFYPGFDIALDVMKQDQALQPFEVFDGRCLVALDGSEFHNSYNIHCPKCSHRLRNSAETEYYHSVLCATMVGIGHRHTVALRPEFMSPQDGDKKQDCESKAASRWFEKNAKHYTSLQPIYLGDDLYAKQPMCERVIDAGADFISRVKTDDHKTLFDYLAGIDWPNKVQIQNTSGRNQPNKEYRYLWTNHTLPIIVVNNVDLPQADLTQSDLSLSISLRHSLKIPKVLTSTATTGEGIPELVNEICSHADDVMKQDRSKSALERTRKLTARIIGENVEREFLKSENSAIERILKIIQSGEMESDSLTREITEKIIESATKSKLD